jgi:SNF2 family DNA or RNA helicase
MEKKAFLFERRILLQFSFDLELLKEVRKLRGAEFKSKVKRKQNGVVKVRKNVWLCDCFDGNIKDLKKLGFKGSKKIVEAARTTKIVLPVVGDIEGLNANLYDYQKEALAYAEYWGGRVLWALDAGLGKTLTSLAYIQKNKKTCKKVLVVVPSCMKTGWRRECKKWIGAKSQILSTRTPYDIEEDIAIINYDIVSYWRDHLKKHGFDTVIIDEIHYLADPTSKRSLAVKAIAKGAESVIGLSGTPIKSKTVQFYNPINIINSAIFSSKRSFENRYCAPRDIELKGGVTRRDVSGSSNLEELHETLCQNVMVRKRKQDVLKDLPKYRRTLLPVQIDMKDYLTIDKEFQDMMDESEDFDPSINLRRVSPLRMETLKQKVGIAKEWIDNFLLSGEKLVVFGVHKKGIEYFMKKYPKIAVKVDGDLTNAKKQENVDRFVNEKGIRIIFMNIQSGSTGIDSLQLVCNNILFVEHPWTPGEMEQAIARLCRIGQRFSVNVYEMMAEYTIDYHVYKLVKDKKEVLNKAVEGYK